MGQGDLSKQGSLLRKDVFTVWENKKKEQRTIRSFKSKTRHMLLYEQVVLICKKKDDSSADSYTLKNSLAVSLLFMFLVAFFILFHFAFNLVSLCKLQVTAVSGVN